MPVVLAALGLLSGLVITALAGRGWADPAAPALARHPGVVAAGTAALWALVAVAAREPVELVLGLVVATLALPVVVVDLDGRRIPNAFTLPAAVAAVALGVAMDPAGTPARLGAGAGAALFLLLPALASPGGMGLGDVKLAGVLGLCLGPPVAVALAAALLAGAALGLVLVARDGLRAARGRTMPFGPHLVAGGVAALLVGHPVLDAYVASW